MNHQGHKENREAIRMEISQNKDNKDSKKS